MTKELMVLVTMAKKELEEFKNVLLVSSPEKILESAGQYVRYQCILDWLEKKGDEVLNGEQIDLLVCNGDILGAISPRIIGDMSESGISYAVGQEIEDLQETEAEETKSYSDLLYEEITKEAKVIEDHFDTLTKKQVMEMYTWDWIEYQDIKYLFLECEDVVSEEDARLLLDKGNVIEELKSRLDHREIGIMEDIEDCLSDLLYDLRKEAKNE